MFEMAAWYAHAEDSDIPFFAQDEKYFKKYELDIRSMYSEGIVTNSINRVAIHVRRAKNPTNPLEPVYSENNFYVNLGDPLGQDIKNNYYLRAMKMFPNENFTVFSDDIKWCKESILFQDPVQDNEYIPISRFEFSEGKNELEDLNFMASHKSHIIANSSFSWWAAYLGQHQAQIVIAPKKWFSDETNEKLIGIPKNWIRI